MTTIYDEVQSEKLQHNDNKLDINDIESSEIDNKKKYAAQYKYQKANPEKFREWNKAYYSRHREVLKNKKISKVYCELCDTSVSYSVLSRHRSTKKHLKNSTNKES